MYSGFHKVAGIVAGALALGGCAQMTRHSNMMIFGTNTVLGIRAGVNATSVPEVSVGYTRQEAVVLPLVANVGPAIIETDDAKHTSKITPVSRTTSGNGTTIVDSAALIPCDPRIPANLPTGQNRPYLVHPCSLVGINGQILDSYSVLASFGGTFKSTAEGTNPRADVSGGVAQYFATGLAAQALALNGGAAAVAGGRAADTASSKNPITVDGQTIRVTQAVPRATGDAGDVLQNYLKAPDPTEAKRRFALAQQAAGAAGLPASPMDIANLAITGRSADCATLVDKLKTLETDPTALAVLKGS